MLPRRLTERASPLLSGDFRRTLQTHLDSIALRDADLYAMTLSPDDGPCLRQEGEGRPLFGRDDIMQAIREWFADHNWSYMPTVLWTMESESTALAVLDVLYIHGEGNTVAESHITQMLVFQRRHNFWRLIFDHRISAAG